MEYYDFKVCPGVREITAYSQKKVNSNMWNHARIFSDGTRVVFSSNEYFIDLNYHQAREQGCFPNTTTLWTQKFSLTDHAIANFNDRSVTNRLKNHRQLERECINAQHSLMIQVAKVSNYIDMVELSFEKETDLFRNFNHMDDLYESVKTDIASVHAEFSEFLAQPGQHYKPYAIKP